ncbi:MAG TPA: hypothetical protein VFH80_23660 [Solirubrobacteraceae bacterium]|nr:hypothetical protein [Solirubrobacteraceae bacterium]
MADSMPAANDAVDVPLFPDYGPPTPEAEPQLSADRRRTLRQAQYVANGVHPLTRGPLHPLASRHRDADSPKSDPFTCGSCYFREVLRWHARSYAKCVLPNPLSGADAPADRIYSRVTHSAASDVRAWWPACRDYSPGDRISPDAARCVPEVDA